MALLVCWITPNQTIIWGYFWVVNGFLTASSFCSGDPGFAAATAASILSAPFINPVRMIEKQQRAFLKQTGAEKPLMDIFREAAAKNFAPLFRGELLFNIKCAILRENAFSR